MIAQGAAYTTFSKTKEESRVEDGLLILNSEGIIIHATPAAEKYFDISLKEIIGKSFFLLFSRQQRQHLCELLNDLKPNNSVPHIITKKRNLGLSTYTLTIHPISVYNCTNMIIVTLHDSTMVGKLLAERELLLRRERAYKESMSHHFFNPLAIAKGYLNLVLNDCSDDAKTKLCAINTALERIENTVKTLIKTGNLE